MSCDSVVFFLPLLLQAARSLSCYQLPFFARNYHNSFSEAEASCCCRFFDIDTEGSDTEGSDFVWHVASFWGV